MGLSILITIIVLALIFDYINGFHDAANAIATIVATKVLSPFQAVIWAAFFNFLAYWVFGFGVADTVAKTADTMQINLIVILAGVIAAIIWNLFTWWFGIPSSSSHTLIGGFAGAAIAYKGLDVVNWYQAGKPGEMPTGVLVIIGFIVLAPLIGAIASYFISIWLLQSAKKSIWPKVFTICLIIATTLLIYSQLIFYPEIKHPRFESHFWSVVLESHNIKWCLIGFIVYTISFFCLIFSSLNHFQSTKWLKKMQLISSASFSLGHGGNDSQKVMGIIAAAIMVYVHQNNLSFDGLPDWLHVIMPYKDASGEEVAGHMPAWIPLACYSAISVGTLSGGWKIVKTMGSKITKVTPFEGVAAETAGALTLYFTEHLKIPVSTTHTITGSIIGSGLTKGVSAVKWGITVKLVWAWVLTIPVSGLLATIVYYILSAFIK
jgi:PiT family inorganic phosphate transporter